MTELHAEGPVLQQQRGDEGEGHAEQGHEDVAHGQVEQPVVGGGAHARGG